MKYFTFKRNAHIYSKANLSIMYMYGLHPEWVGTYNQVKETLDDDDDFDGENDDYYNYITFPWKREINS